MDVPEFVLCTCDDSLDMPTLEKEHLGSDEPDIWTEMDKRAKAVSPRVERRRKWYDEKRKIDKDKARVTRARTMENQEQKKPQVIDAPTVSERGFKTKYNVQPNNKNNTSKSKMNSSANKQLKRKHSEKDSNGEVAKNNMKNKVKQELESVATDDLEKEAKTTPKKAKYEYVDVVDKLESSTSVHIPKRFILFVGNLPDDVTKEMVEEHFRKTGGVKSVRLPRDKITDQPKGFAFVEFNSTISHRIALRLHNTTLCGQKIVVEFTSNGKMSKKQIESIKDRDSGSEPGTPLKMPFDT